MIWIGIAGLVLLAAIAFMMYAVFDMVGGLWAKLNEWQSQHTRLMSDANKEQRMQAEKIMEPMRNFFEQLAKAGERKNAETDTTEQG